MDNIKLVHYLDSDRETFIRIVESALRDVWGENLHENYSRDNHWGLLTLLDHGKLDSYTLLYVNDVLLGGSGGRIRNWQNNTVYQAGFRGFSRGLLKNSLGATHYMYSHNLAYQISRAKENKCNSIVLSFNSYNERLYRVVKDYHLPKVYGKNAWKDYEKPLIFNGVEQWILQMFL